MEQGHRAPDIGASITVLRRHLGRQLYRGSSDVLDFGSVNMGLSQGSDYGGDAGVRDAGENSLLRDTYQKLYGTGGQ